MAVPLLRPARRRLAAAGAVAVLALRADRGGPAGVGIVGSHSCELVAVAASHRL